MHVQIRSISQVLQCTSLDHRPADNVWRIGYTALLKSVHRTYVQD